MTTGFLLGKFAPLHRGHQLLIETALAENDRVVVMIYDVPEITSVPLPVRSSWLRRLYPQIQIIEAWDGPLEVSDDPEIKSLHETYILNKLGAQQIDNFYSSEFYGYHMSQALKANDRRIDSQRVAIPVSGTELRRNPYVMREYLNSIVYRDLIIKVVFLGAPSTGKTTLARELANQYKTVWMPEYGREYWEARQCERKLSLEELVEIAEGHRTREDQLTLDANRFLFVDTDATTTLMFSHYYHNQAEPQLVQFAREAVQRADLFFLCGDDIPYEDTLDRSGEAHREVFQKQTRADLIQRKLPFITLTGSLETRIQTIRDILEGFDKYESLIEHFFSRHAERDGFDSQTSS